MPALNKDTLKKHHFWILVGITPLFVLIAAIMVTSGVGAAIDSRNDVIKKAKAAFNGKENPKSEVFLGRFKGQIETLGKKRTNLWKENWERQIGLSTRMAGNKEVLVQNPSRNLLRWPVSKLLNRFNYTVNYEKDKDQLRFGDPIPDQNGEDQEFTKPEVYLVEFSNAAAGKDISELPPEKRTGMADRVYPTTFAGGWQNVLRYVNSWGSNKIRSELLWLALEDIWVQRAMLGCIESVNESIGAFTKVPRYENGAKVPETPLDRSFASRTWLLNIKATPRQSDGRYVLTGTLRNRTDRLQLLGNNNTLILNVWLSKTPGDSPVQFKIGGEFVPGGSAMAIAPTEEHVLPPGRPVLEIAKVEQVFDSRTVPIRRIDHLALGKKDSRYTAVPLNIPLFKSFQKEEEAAKAAAGGGGDGTAGGGFGGPPMGGSGGPPPGGSGGPPPGASGAKGQGNNAAAEGQMEGGGDVATVLDGNRKRYIDKPTTQVRRMPVAICIVVDQAYMQDVLLAYANSPMRFQITQWHWQRFRGSLGDSGSSGGNGPGGNDVLGPARGYEGSGIKLGGAGSLMGPSRGSGGPPPGPGRPPMGLPPTGIGSKGPGPMMPGVPGATSPYGGSGGGLSTISEGQLTAGLVELTVYGIVSLYEKYADAPAQTDAIAP